MRSSLDLSLLLSKGPMRHFFERRRKLAHIIASSLEGEVEQRGREGEGERERERPLLLTLTCCTGHIL